MFWIFGYIALVAYSAGLFTWSVAHGREAAAVGILLSISGLQLAILETINPGLGIGLAVAGLMFVGRDIATNVRHGMRLVPALIRPSGRIDEAA